MCKTPNVTVRFDLCSRGFSRSFVRLRAERTVASMIVRQPVYAAPREHASLSHAFSEESTSSIFHVVAAPRKVSFHGLAIQGLSRLSKAHAEKIDESIVPDESPTCR